MSNLQVLVVEDEQNWQEALPEILQRLGHDVHVDVAPNYGVALQHVLDQPYDLAIVDLALLGNPTDSRDSDQLGMDLLHELRRSRHNQGCALIVLTGYPTTERTQKALLEYAAHSVIEKQGFDDRRFLDIVRQVIRTARLQQAAARSAARYRLTVTFNHEQLLGSELTGPDRRAIYLASQPIGFDVTDLTRRTNMLNMLILNGRANIWRPEARSIGGAIYEALSRDRHIHGDLVAARALADRFSDLWIEFRGPAPGLGVPFELLRDEDDYLCLRHILTRSIVQAGPSLSRKPTPFHAFVETLLKAGERLRILVVGANSDGHIPEVNVEASSVTASITAELQRIDIPHEVTTLTGTDATYTRLSEALHDGRYHIFHYAGHGRFDDVLPEVSGLILRDGNALRTLTASDLNFLARETELRLVFLSCCLGGRTGAEAGHGDFYGTLDSLARADVPLLLGYRWTVADTPARILAERFYQALWRTFSPGDSLLDARSAVAMEHQGRDDETWASPVLLMQTA